MKKVPRILIAGTNSGCGKTTVVCGILSALKQREIKAASCKCGPDYIDPMFHSQVFGIPSRNLDLFFSNREQVSYLLAKNSKDTQITIIEGVMGYYDGMKMADTEASAYDLAKQTNTPSILIVNAKGMALSVIAMMKGFLEFRKDHTIQGVILNGVTSMTGKMLSEIIERELSIKVYGCIPKLTDFQLSSRHLGLVTPHELGQLQEELQKLGEKFLEYIDIDGLLQLAESAPELSEEMPEEWKKELLTSEKVGQGMRIGIGWDKAFCFYYQENLELLEALGCELVKFSPLNDQKLPENIDALLLGGGYPEVCAKELHENSSMIHSIKTAIENGMPVLAECGGFMYLHEMMEDEQGQLFSMVGAIKGKSINKKKLVRFGYINVQANKDNPYLLDGESIKAHEFHYWDSENNGDVFLAKKPTGTRKWTCTHVSENMIAGYPHFYYYSNIKMIKRFLKNRKRNQ